MSFETDWISAVCSLVAALIGMVTLSTVFVAARQLLTEHRLYQLGLAQDSLGPWCAKVETSRLFGLQRQICTPTVSLPTVVKRNWKPTFKFPVGHAQARQGSSCDIDSEEALPKASWVNFMEALGIAPENGHLYEMNVQSDLVNGMIPMRWKGKDLVGICSILGFQSHEDKPSFKNPMPLPIQWSGPLGWLQFRASADGCVVEFRRRMDLANQLPLKIHRFYENKPLRGQSHALRTRLWQSINGMCLPNNKLLYVGGADSPGPRELGRVKEQLAQKFDELGKLIQDVTNSKHSADGTDQANTRAEELFKELLDNDFTEKELLDKLNAGNPDQSPRASTESTRKDSEHLPEFFREMMKKTSGKKEVLISCPGLLSVVVQGELAYSRGLDIKGCKEYHRVYTEPNEVDKEKFPYNLGDLQMDQELLSHMKEAMSLLKPDGFFFSPTAHLLSDITEVYRHVGEQCYNLDHIFVEAALEAWPEKMKGNCEHKETIKKAMLLCNEFQRIKKTSRAVFTVEDMQIISKASESLSHIISPAGSDLVWAMLVHPGLFSCLGQHFAKTNNLDFLDKKVPCKSVDKVGRLECEALLTSCGVPEKVDEMVFEIPLCSEGSFDGFQVVAAFMDVFLTYFWIDKKWVSDVAMYDATIPQTITMC